ncbi:unnamed protein product [Sphagnum jensenii]|uniref:Protein kinase domain-containing protein n=1 Tax=Sphagnum jensenii TaxID=128206 RepID=A0ABP0VXP9_9BRYO
MSTPTVRIFMAAYSCRHMHSLQMWIIIFFLKVLLSCSSLGAHPSEALSDEGHALLEFGMHLHDPCGSLENWRHSDPTPCEWAGVTCSSDQLHILSINLAGKQLGGNITLDVTGLPWLQALNLSSNLFEGHIPASFGNFSSLRILKLQSNNLSGAIPPELGLLLTLTDLDLSNNKLQGEIPESLNSLTKLSFLNLSSNSFKGHVPQGGVLASFSATSFHSNSELCGRPTLQSCNLKLRSLLDLTNATSNSNDNNTKGKLNVGVILTICICAFVASKIFIGTLCYWRWKRQHQICEIKLSGGKMVMFQLSGKATPSSKAVLRQTEKLKQTDIIGSGGYGKVYKLVLPDNTTFAVKKLERGSKDRERGFERELETLADIKHRNLVSLRGYYSAPHINILIYDLMTQGNLDTLLHDYANHGREPLDWESRLNIAIGSARGLSYLHHDCIPHIIHRDVKCSNILLDEDMEAHVADFGLAKLIGPQETHVTTIIAGTLGYLPPEYMDTGKVTEKGDVYSFGIVLLELLTGNRPTDQLYRENNFSMVQWAKHLVEMGRAGDLFYHTLLDSCPDEELLAVLDIALQCVNSVSTLRPSMLKVVKMLERIRGGGDNLGGGGGSLSSHLSLYNIPSSQLTTPTSPCSHPSSQISLC